MVWLGCTTVFIVRVDLISKEYPPNIYGGAGVHVAELTKALRKHITVKVRAFGAPVAEPDTVGYAPPTGLNHASNPAVQTLATDLSMVEDVAGADLVHSHTWYANQAGTLASQLHGIPHVLTAHSLEPLRPWKAEQLGGGYRLSSWIEREAYRQADAVIAVSEGMRQDILRSYPFVNPQQVRVIHNGIDTELWQPTASTEVLERYGLDPARPTIVFVGRITRQKGLPFFLRAVAKLPPEVQVVLCAGAPDTPEIMHEVRGLVTDLRDKRTGVIWIEDMLPRPDLSAILTAATAFACPSVYEPLGIVNLEAMSCGVAVVGTATGGIPEVIEDGVTGRLVPIEQVQDGTGTPLDPETFVDDMANALIEVVSDADTARRMGQAGRNRAVTHFSWQQIAKTTLELYRELTR